VATLFGQHAVAWADDHAVYSAVIPVPVRTKRKVTP
jgi:hypothetical protein